MANIARSVKVIAAFAALLAVATTVAACTNGGTPSRVLGEAATLEQLLDAARQVEADLQSYRHTLDATGWSQRSGEERSESQWRVTGEWSTPGNVRMEVSVPSDERVNTYQHMRVEDRYFLLIERDEGVWRETGFPQPGEPPTTFLGERAWELVAGDATLNGLSVYHLRSTGTQERPYDDGEWEDGRTLAITDFAHDLYVSHGDMLPRRLETFSHFRSVRADGEAMEETRGLWVYDFFDHNAPVSIEVPEPRVDLPPTPEPGATPTPRATPTPSGVGTER